MSRRRGRLGAAAAASATAALLAGCATGSQAPSQRPAASPSASSAAVQADLRRADAARYLAIAQAGNRRLEAEFDRLHGRDHRALAAARADLRNIAATEHLFDQRLLGISFPPAIAVVARALYRVNQSRASLTAAAAQSLSLRQLAGYLPRLTAANAPVEQAVRAIRRQLGLPPPETS